MHQIMTAKSQSIEDIVKETREKNQYIPIDKPLGRSHKEIFESVKSRLDPSIYKGESKAYKVDPKSYESGNQALDRMSKQSGDLKGWIADQRYEAEKKIGPKAGYNFQRDTAASGKSASSKYSGPFEDMAKQYLMGEGKELYSHLKGQGREFYDITRIGTANLDGAVAALAIQGNEAALLGAKDFDKKVSDLAGIYGIPRERAISYVMAHEFVHASQKGKYFSTISAELDVEHTLKSYFTAKGEKDLAYIAGDRAGKVARNYGGESPVSAVSSYGKAAA